AAHSIVMAIGNESAPKGRDFIVPQSDVVTGDGAGRKSRKHERLWIAPVTPADQLDRFLAIVHRRLRVPPPLAFVPPLHPVHVGRAKPQKSLPAGDSVNTVRSLH